MDLHGKEDDTTDMYEITCPTTGQHLHLDHSHVISSHRVSKGHVVYLRCDCDAVVMWTTSSAPALHPVRTLATAAA